MSADITQLTERLNKLKIQIAVNNEKVKTSLEELENFLTSIDNDFIDMLIPITPDVVILKNLTIESIQNDSERVIINKLIHVLDILNQYIESELSRFEEMI